MMKTAILIIDMQNDFFENNLVLGKRKLILVKNINDLLDYARKKKMSIIFVRQEFKQDLSNAYLFMEKNGCRVTIKGTPGARILNELNRKENDLVVIKKRYSAFFKTDLEKLLKNKKISTLILGGINTHACVRMTAIDAYSRDFHVILAKNCISSWDKQHHDVTIRYLRKSMGIETLSNEQLKNKF